MACACGGNCGENCGCNRTTLDEMEPGVACRVRKLNVRGKLARRLMDMGFFPGVEIEVVRNAPLVDPVELRLGGGLVTVRHEDARLVEVFPI